MRLGRGLVRSLQNLRVSGRSSSIAERRPTAPQPANRRGGAPTLAADQAQHLVLAPRQAQAKVLGDGVTLAYLRFQLRHVRLAPGAGEQQVRLNSGADRGQFTGVAEAQLVHLFPGSGKARF